MYTRRQQNGAILTMQCCMQGCSGAGGLIGPPMHTQVESKRSRPSETQACLCCGYVHESWERKRRLGRAETRDHKHSVQKERQSKGKAYE